MEGEIQEEHAEEEAVAEEVVLPTIPEKTSIEEVAHPVDEVHQEVPLVEGQA